MGITQQKERFYHAVIIFFQKNNLIQETKKKMINLIHFMNTLYYIYTLYDETKHHSGRYHPAQKFVPSILWNQILYTEVLGSDGIEDG